MALSYLFHSYPVHILYGNQAILSLFSSHLPRQVLYFCFFEEEDRKIIKKGLPFFLAFLWIVGVPVDVNVTDSLSVFCPFCPPLTLVFPLVKSMYGQKKSSQTCGNFKCHLPAVHFLNWSDYSCLTFQKQANANLLIGHQCKVKIICSHNGWTLFSA